MHLEKWAPIAIIVCAGCTQTHPPELESTQPIETPEQIDVILQLGLDEDSIPVEEERLTAEAKAYSARRRLFEAAQEFGASHIEMLRGEPAVAVSLSPELVDALAESLGAEVYPDLTLYPHLDETIPQIRADIAPLNATPIGSGQTIVVVDTGVEASHPFFGGRVTDGRCFYSQSSEFRTESFCTSFAPGVDAAAPCEHEDCFHGTHVAGIAAGLNSDMRGVASQASIISMMVFRRSFGDACIGEEPCITSSDSTIDQALAATEELADTVPIAAVNISIGGIAPPEFADRRLRTLERLWRRGIAVVASAGNHYQLLPDRGLSYPAAHPQVISVGAVDGDDEVASFSAQSRTLDLLAPGVDVSSSIRGGDYASHEGTSMAAPHVAGAIALLRSKRPECSAYNIVEALKKTGVVVEDARTEGVVIETPRIDVRAALAALDCFPEEPFLVSAFPDGERTLRVGWTDRAPNEDRFEIRVVDEAGNLVSAATAPANTSADDRTRMVVGLLEPGRTYRVGVRACRGLACSPYVDDLNTATTDAHPRPLRPTDLRLVAAGTDFLDIAWTPAAGGPAPSAYSIALIGRRTRRVVLPASARTFRWDHLDADELYNITMGACDSTGCSTGTYLTARTLGVGQAPTNLHVQSRTASSVQLAWSNTMTGVTHHEIEVTRSTGYGMVTDVQTSASANPTANIAITTAEFQQSFRVRACNASGCTVYSRTAH